MIFSGQKNKDFYLRSDRSSHHLCRPIANRKYLCFSESQYLRFAKGFLTLGGNLLRVNRFFSICVCDTKTQKIMFGVVWKRKRVSWKHVSFSRKKHFYDRGWKRKHMRFRFQEKNSLSVVNRANNDPAKTPRVN